jgi:hypothetical protein
MGFVLIKITFHRILECPQRPEASGIAGEIK